MEDVQRSNLIPENGKITFERNQVFPVQIKRPGEFLFFFSFFFFLESLPMF